MGRPLGSVNRVGFLVRFWGKVLVLGEDECWPWLGGRNNHGYGSFRVRSQRGILAHVVAYEFGTANAVPRGHDVDHSCRNRLCMNPAHLGHLSKSDHGRKSALQRWKGDSSGN